MRWATDAGVHEARLEIELPEPRRIDRIQIHEPAEYQRVESFELQYLSQEGQWQTLHQGKQIGPDWKLRIPPTTVGRLRLNILQASEGPTLWEFQAFGPQAPQ